MSDTQWVDRAIAETATTIHNRIVELLAATAALGNVSPDYVIEHLLESLASKLPDPAMVAWLDRQNGAGSTKLSAAVNDWIDRPAER